MNEIIKEIKALEERLTILAAIDASEVNDEQVKEMEDVSAALENKRAEKAEVEAKEEKRIAARNRANEIAKGLLKGQSKPKVVFPESIQRGGKLKAFESREDAYRAGQFFSSVFGSESAKRWCLDNGVYGADIHTKDDRRGGLFVPTQVENTIIRLVEEYGIFRGLANKSPMSSNHKIEFVRTSGMTAYPVVETDNLNDGSNSGTRSNPQYDQVELIARKWKVWTKVSDEFNEDTAVAMADKLVVEMASAFAYAEDNAGFNGDGTSSHHGIMGLTNALAAGSVLDLATGEQAFSDLALADFHQAIGMVPNWPNMNQAWYISKPGYYASMDPLKSAAGGVNGYEIEKGWDQEFMGYPVRFVNVMHKGLTDVASTPLVYFGDLSMAALFGDRRGITTSMSSERFWDEDQVGIKATERFDINIHQVGDASNAGPVVMIKSAAS